MNIPPMAILTALIFLNLGCGKKDEPAEIAKEKKANFALTNTTSSELLNKIGTYKNNKPVLVNFWATWCKPCIEELPHLLQLREEHGDKVEFIFVSFDFEENRSQVSDFLRNQGVKFETYFKNEDDQIFLNNMPDSWTGALPYTMLYKKDGTMVKDFMGGQTLAEFRKHLNHVLQLKEI